eukprot:1156610-Pelagomonas_calceolata.AAC.2
MLPGIPTREAGQVLPARTLEQLQTTDCISTLFWMLLLGPGPGGAHSRDFAVHLLTISACR